MKSINKIRERDMDEAFLLSLRSGINMENLDNLLSNYLRKDEADNLLSNYLRKDEADNLLSNYLRKDEIIDIAQLPIDELNDLIGCSCDKTSSNLVPIEVMVNHDSSNYVVKIADDDGTIHDVFVYTEQKEGSNSGISIEAQQTIANLQAQVSILKNKIETLESQKNDTSTLHYDSLVEQIKQLQAENEKLTQRVDNYGTAIQTVESRLNESEFGGGIEITKEMLDQDIIDSINKIDDFESLLDGIKYKYIQRGNAKEGQLLYCTLGDEAIAQGRDIVVSATICANNEEVEQAKEQKKEFIINLDNHMCYDYDEEDDDYDEESFTDGHQNDNVLIFDVDTETIRFIVVNEKFIDFANGSSSSSGNVSITTKAFEIPLNQSVEVERLNNLRKVPPTVLIKDKLVDSRTYGKYINSEGFVTVSNSESAFTIYNDSPYVLEVLVMLMNSAPGGNVIYVDDENGESHELLTEGGDGE